MYLKKNTSFTKKALTAAVAIPLLLTSVIGAIPADAKKNNEVRKTESVQLEYLDRGLVAVSTSQGSFLSWRLLANEASGYSENGLTGVNFNVYRDGKKIATVEDSTNFLDKEGNAASEYYVSAVKNGKEIDQSAAVSTWDNQYYDLPLKKPSDGVTPSGESYTYSANDMSVGDVDGDGQYEYFVKWDPSNSKDVSQKGYTGNVYIDCYKFDGTLLYRIDLGVNIRAGAHYTQMMVYDFDGDGKAESMFKTAPGSKIIKYDKQGNVTSEKYITMPKEDLDKGFSNEDDYRMSAGDYHNHMVDMFMGWHEHEEVVNGNWPETLEEAFGIEKKYTYPLSKEDAESLANYFIDEYAPGRSTRNELRTFEGFIVDGPEYLSVFEGATGDELETIHYKQERHDDGLMWGDYAMSRIEPGNRVDRFLAGVAYLDGKKPYAVFARGYYTRSSLVTYSWDGKHLKENWSVDSGWTPMSNPFNDSPHGRSGTDEEFGTLTTQGAHSLSTADVDGDGDGKQEIIYGGATIDHDGSLLYSSMDTLPEGSGDPGTTARLGHGDALHVADIDPDRSGLEIFMVHEGGSWAPYGYSLRDAKTGEVIYGGYTGKDTGRGMVGDVDPSQRGLETWAVGLWTADGSKISDSAPGTNMNIKWSADMTTQFINGSGNNTPTIDDWKKGRLLTADDTRTNNGTKGNPSLVADTFGDWREELHVRKADSSAIRIYLSTDVTDRKLYTLMHDVQYRTGIAWQNTTYNQPAYPSFYFASDTDWRDVPTPEFWTPGVMSKLKKLMDEYEGSGELKGSLFSQLTNTYKQAEHQLEKGSTQKAVRFMEKFVTQINQKTNHGDISQKAKNNLSHHAKTLLEMWNGEEKKLK
ncbi:rhamnogalacturonan lyase [Metabacillus herbersteinensis]|uniref:Rhamnogalacturonan lyase n=1 Tax=Metabacillus herbersteinensis TaxID=283816 RepID=A0ABV6GA89_9BACI